MKKELFSIPFFFDKVNLNKISLIDKETKPTFVSGVQSSFNTHRVVKQETLLYLTELIWKNIKCISKGAFNIEISEIWRNTYTETDFQEPHIHPKCQWSFVIYENINESKTVFQNPSRYLLNSCIDAYGINDVFVESIKPKLTVGDIVIFPSFVEHYVLSGGVGTTISGNVHITRNEN